VFSASLRVSLFRFTVTIEGADVLTDDAQEALFEAGCGDGTFGISNGVQMAEFDRDAVDFAEAVAGVIKAIEGGVAGANVTAVTRERGLTAAG
jgi:hypothetical protein